MLEVGEANHFAWENDSEKDEAPDAKEDEELKQETLGEDTTFPTSQGSSREDHAKHQVEKNKFLESEMPSSEGLWWDKKIR